MEYRTPSTVYKKHSNARSFNDQSAYDGVFSAQSKHGAPVFSARVEDYREIFGGSRVSSIPILEVPALSERKFPVDVPSSKHEYSKIFGGFDESNFAMPFEELLAASKKTNSISEGARTSDRRRSLAAEYPSQNEKENNLSTHEASSQSCDRKEKFNMSFQKLDRGRKNGTNGTTDVAPNAVPCFAHSIDECSPVQTCKARKPASVELNDIFPTNPQSKVDTKPDLPIASDNEQTQARSTNLTECQNRIGRYRSDSVDKLFNACDTDGNGAQCPETPPKGNVLPEFGNSDRFSETTMDFKPEAFEHFEDAGNVWSPPDIEEVDVNSVAAASVAALRKAIDDAHERIKIAKELMERRKAGLQKRKKMRSSRSLSSEKIKDVRTSNNTSTWKEKIAVESYETAAAEGVSSEITREHHFINMDFKSTEVGCGEEEAEEQFYEPSSSPKDEAKEIEYAEEENAERTVYRADDCESKGDSGLKETLRSPGEGGNSFLVVKEGNERVESSIKLSVVKGILLSKLKSVLGVTEQERDVINSGQNLQETEMKSEAFMEEEKCLELLEEFHVTEEGDEKLAIRETGEKNNVGSQVEVDELVEEELRHICQQEEIEMETNIVPIEKEADWKLENSYEQERTANCINDFQFQDDEEADNLKENSESVGSKVFQENKESDEMIKGHSFHLYSNEIECPIVENTKIDEDAEHESMVKAENSRSNENELEMTDGFCVQHKCDDLLNDQEASNSVESMRRMEVIYNKPVLGDVQNITEVAKISVDAINIEAEIIKQEDDMEDKTSFSETKIEMENTHANPFSNQSWIDFGEINIREQKQYDMPVNGSSIFCNLGNTEGSSHEQEEIESNLKKVEVLTDEEDNTNDSHDEEVLNTMDNIEADHLPSIYENVRKFEVAEESITGTVNGTDEEKTQTTTQMEESECNYVLEKEMQLESDRNTSRADDQSGTTETNHTPELIHEIKTSQSQGDNEVVHQATMTGDDMELRDSSDKEVEHAFHWGNLEEANIFRREVNLAHTDQEISTSQTVIQNENHETTPTLGEVELDTNMPEEAETKSEYRDHKKAHLLFQEKDDLEELAESLTSQSALEHGNPQATLLMEEKEANEKLEKDAEAQKEQQRKIDEAKERERERERIAVERAIREARGRAFAEARERAAAEKATADTRRRIMAEARERSVKISPEANDKPAAEKVSMEARLKAQRAAVERATAEARERALEKAMSEKTISEARNLADKIVAEKLSSTVGDGKMKKNYSFNGPQPNNSCPSSNFRHAQSFNLGGSDYSERDGASAGESVQRCKARLGRHQRTVERVAKALAEKNIRDILSQREQEERNRIAEALDAEVKRWSSGKEGNLRALLSTLQYILGADSGWQPIPLTDIITATAVKKAYRRATLSVHPDKLQQRGASIQQKYICEKVFDLIKAAWNKFNVEER